MPILILSIFLSSPAPLDMPRAEAYLVKEDGRQRLEDRFVRTDLWISQTVIGRWIDDDWRQFVLAELSARPPAVDKTTTVTRTTAAEEREPIPRVRANDGFPPSFREALQVLSPCPLLDKPRSSRQLPRGYRDVCYWQSPTNLSTIVCTFRPERTNLWYLATWELADGDDYPTQVGAFEDEFLGKEFAPFLAALPPRPVPHPVSERDRLRNDAQHSIAAYPNWRFSGSGEFAVLDDLPARELVRTLTNDFPVMRARYAAALPTPIDGTNVLCVARVYANREEYLEALAADGMTNMVWSAAYWSPNRRELVAYLPTDGGDKLLQTFRHEAFHQYLTYAMSMIPASPWLNEGYAQYFEQGVEDPFVDPADLASLAGLVPPLLMMDYEEFYGGTDRERELKYRLALATAYFIEKGAPKVRFAPFKDLKRDYVKALLETRDMRKATASAFGNADRLGLFVAEWTKYWKNQ